MSTEQPQSQPTEGTPEYDAWLEVEGHHMSAVVRLAFARDLHPELVRAEAAARVELAAAIMLMDEAADQPGRHNLQEQARVEECTRAYAQALADLLRGETSEADQVANAAVPTQGVDDFLAAIERERAEREAGS